MFTPDVGRETMSHGIIFEMAIQATILILSSCRVYEYPNQDFFKVTNLLYRVVEILYFFAYFVT